MPYERIQRSAQNRERKNRKGCMCMPNTMLSTRKGDRGSDVSLPPHSNDDTTIVGRGNPPQSHPPEIARRLVVELTKKSASDLGWLLGTEELNKTTLVNRAIQVYRMVIEAQRDGRTLYFEDPGGEVRDRLMVIP